MIKRKGKFMFEKRLLLPLTRPISSECKRQEVATLWMPFNCILITFHVSSTVYTSLKIALAALPTELNILLCNLYNNFSRVTLTFASFRVNWFVLTFVPSLHKSTARSPICWLIRSECISLNRFKQIVSRFPLIGPNVVNPQPPKPEHSEFMRKMGSCFR